VSVTLLQKGARMAKNDEVKFDHKTATNASSFDQSKYGQRTGSNGTEFRGTGSSGYYLEQDKDGQLRCSCGRSLVKLDNYTFKCSGGWPIYRPEDGTVEVDKFGNIQIRVIPHGQNKKQKRGKQNES
jgi:hypothetical protein